MNNFFELFGLEEKFWPDEEKLTQVFYEKIRLTHPDHQAGDLPAQADAIKETAQINEGFNVLKSFEKRVLYILVSKGKWNEGEKHTLPPDFLMDMLDLNDEISEAVTNGDEKAKEHIMEELNERAGDIMVTLNLQTRKYDETPEDDLLEEVKEQYQKLQYLKRLKLNLIQT